MKNDTVRARIEGTLKADAVQVLASHGLDLSDAIRLFLRQVVARGGMPFAIRNPNGPWTARTSTFQQEKIASQERDRADVAGGIGDGRPRGPCLRVLRGHACAGERPAGGVRHGARDGSRAALREERPRGPNQGEGESNRKNSQGTKRSRHRESSLKRLNDRHRWVQGM